MLSPKMHRTSLSGTGVARSAAVGGDIARKQLRAGAFVSLAHCAPHWTAVRASAVWPGREEKHSSEVPACSESLFAQNSCGAAMLGLGFCGYELSCSKVRLKFLCPDKLAFICVCHGDSGSVGASLRSPGYSPETSFGGPMSKGRQLGEKTV